MSRVAKAPVVVPAGVAVLYHGQNHLKVKGPSRVFNARKWTVVQEEQQLKRFLVTVCKCMAQAGTARCC